MQNIQKILSVDFFSVEDDVSCEQELIWCSAFTA